MKHQNKKNKNKHMNDILPFGFKPSLIELGTLKAFKARLTRLGKRIRGRKYRFRQFTATEEGEFWLFESEDADEILGALLQVQNGLVYAISEDVLSLLENEFLRKG